MIVYKIISHCIYVVFLLKGLVINYYNQYGYNYWLKINLDDKKLAFKLIITKINNLITN